MNLLSILPMALVMVAGSQLVAAVFLASGAQPRRASLAYLAGAAIVVTGGVGLAYLLTRTVKKAAGGGGGGGGRSPVETWIDAVVLALLVVLAVVVFLRRKSSGQPKWMGRLERADAGYAFRIGLLLFLLMPTDDLTMATVGASAARHDLPWWHLLPFVLLTLLLLALPLLVVLLLGRRASVVLPRIRDWVDHHSWVVSELVIVFFIGITLADLLR